MRIHPAFARLVALPENRSALSALEELLLNGEQQACRLLFMHGSTGSGKTALVEALVDGLGPDKSVCRCSAQDLVPPAAIQDEAGSEPSPSEMLFEARACDLLIVENLQHLPPWADEPLVQIVDERLRHQLPMVFTALEGPGHLCRRGIPLSARLTSRLAAGLVVALEPWQSASRLVYLRERARQRGVDVPAETLTWLAENLTEGGRQLEGALGKIETLRQLQPLPLDADQLRAHFQGEVDAQRPTVERIAERVGASFATTPRAFTSRRRSRALLVPRQVSMYLARQLTRLSLQQIGAFFGRDHSTVLHACRKVEAALQSDTALAGMVRRLSAELA